MAEIAVSLAVKEAEGLLDKLVNKLYTTVSGELSLLLGVREEIRFIRDELEVMSAFLRGAEEKQSSDPDVKAWIKQVKVLAYAAEDAIDEFSLVLTRHHSTNLATALWHRVRSISKLGARHRIVVQIRCIKLKVEEASQRRLRYEITHKASASADVDIHGSQYDPRSAALFVHESQLVGIDRPREILVQWLLDGNEPRLSLLVMVGAGGSGKTTVAKKAYESPNVTSGHFSCRAWITVSQLPSIPVLLREMFRQLISPPPQDLDNIMDLTEKLRGHLKDRRYVVIFDDIWKINAWNSLQHALPENGLGSRIIITTRNNGVADSCLTDPIIYGSKYMHKLLSEEHSRELFYKRMSLDQDTCPENLKNLFHNILRKCGGLPLAIVSIAAALASKPKNQIKEWEAMINDRLGSEFESNPNLQNVMQVLNFSYADLPYNVKQCFLYLSKFPEDSLIKSKRIKSLWIAEGLVNVRRGMSSEEVAESYLNELVSRHMVLPSDFSVVTGKVKSFRIHDVMLEMIVSKSTEENFLTLVQKDSIWTQQEEIRRLSVITEKFPEEMRYIPEGIDISHVRSLTIFGSYGQAFFSPKMRLLRVLDLEGYEGLSDEHLEVSCWLFHLKYLSLKDTRTRQLPSRMGNLCNLETLDIRGCYGIKTIPGIAKLKRLRFLRSDLANLLFPSGIGKLRNLHELGTVRIVEEGMLEGLQELTQLRKLSVRVWGFNSDFCVSRLSLEKLSGSLRSLTIFLPGAGYMGRGRITFPDDMELPPLKLESLKLDGRLHVSSSGPPGRQLPHWFRLLENLARLSLKRTEIGEDALHTIGALPNLIKLHLCPMAYRGDTLCFRAREFPSLKVLSLSSSGLFLLIRPSTTDVIFEEEALQCVGSVAIDEYEKIVGVENLTSLSDIALFRCRSATENKVKEAVAAHPKRPRLTILQSPISLRS